MGTFLRKVRESDLLLLLHCHYSAILPLLPLVTAVFDTTTTTTTTTTTVLLRLLRDKRSLVLFSMFVCVPEGCYLCLKLRYDDICT